MEWKGTSTRGSTEFTILGEVEGGWQPTFTVVITAYFTEAGSDDYVYSVRVTED